MCLPNIAPLSIRSTPAPIALDASRVAVDGGGAQATAQRSLSRTRMRGVSSVKQASRVCMKGSIRRQARSNARIACARMQPCRQDVNASGHKSVSPSSNTTWAVSSEVTCVTSPGSKSQSNGAEFLCDLFHRAMEVGVCAASSRRVMTDGAHDAPAVKQPPSDPDALRDGTTVEINV